jgi:hypothetical protein
MQRKRQGHHPHSPKPLGGTAGHPRPGAAPADNERRRPTREVWQRVAPRRVQLSGRGGDTASNDPPGLLEPPDPKSGRDHGPCHHRKVRRLDSPTGTMTERHVREHWVSRLVDVPAPQAVPGRGVGDVGHA